MARRKVHAGIASNMIPIFVRDTSSTTGAGLSGLTIATSGLTAEYRRKGASAWTAITLVSATLGTYTSGGFIADGSLSGAYEFDPPDAAFASGATSVQIRLYGATNMLPVLLEFELDAIDYQDGTRAGLSALPNAAAGASGGLPMSVDAAGGVNASKIGGTTQTGADLGAVERFPVVLECRCQSGTGAALLELDPSVAVHLSGYYTDLYFKIVSGTGAGQFGFIANYVWDGTFANAYLPSSLPIAPDTTSNVAVYFYRTTSNLVAIMGNYLTQTQSITRGFQKFFDVVSAPNFNVSSMIPTLVTSLFQDLLSSSDFSTSNSIGALLKANLDTNIGSRAATGAKMDLVDAPNATALTAIAAAIWSATTRTLTAIADSSGVTTLLNRIAQAIGFDAGGNVKSAPQTDGPTNAKLATMLQGTGPYAFTTAALVNAPSGGGGGGLSGPNQITLTFTDSNNVPIQNVEFSIGGAVGPRTNSSGVASFGLPTGSYTVVAGPVGLISFPATPITVAGALSQTIVGTAANIAAGTTSQTNAYGYTRDGHGAIVTGMTVWFRLLDPATPADVWQTDEFSAISDGTGLLQVLLPKNAKCAYKTAAGSWQNFTTGNASTYALPELLGLNAAA